MPRRRKFWEFVERPITQTSIGAVLAIIGTLVPSKIFMVFAGFLFLLAVQREGWLSGPDWYTRISKTVFTSLAIAGLLAAILYLSSAFREQPRTQAIIPQQPQSVSEPLQVHLITWGIHQNMVAYGVIDAHEIKRFQNSYRLMLAVRTFRGAFDWQDDPWVEKSGLFTIEDEVTIEIPLSQEFKKRLASKGPGVAFFYGVIPNGLQVQNARNSQRDHRFGWNR